LSATQTVLLAITEALGKRAPAIDADDGLKQLTIVVVLNERTGKALRVVVRSESQEDLGRRDGRA
jgi:hypothetical protein